MFIKFGNTLINIAHIVDASFAPANGAAKAMLRLRFAVTESCDSQDYDKGRTPYSRRIEGTDAEFVWSRLLLALPVADREW